MAKEILLYTSFSSWSVADFINTLEANKGNEICIRINSPGGSVYDGFGAIAKYKEFPSDKKIKVDGRADSMAAYMVAMTPTDQVECLDVSTFTFHRAAMPAWFEADARYFTEDVRESLNTVNSTLRGFIESKVTAEKWKKVTGVSLDDMFSLNSRIDVPVSSEKMKQLGMVATINKITPKKLAEIKSYCPELAAEYEPMVEASTDTNIENKNQNKMTLQDVKANSEIYAAIKAEVLAEEKDRIESFGAFKDVDAKAVLEAILSGESYRSSFGAKMQAAALKNTGVTNMAEATKGATPTPETATDKTPEAMAVESFDKGVRSNLLAHFNIGQA